MSRGQGTSLSNNNVLYPPVTSDVVYRKILRQSVAAMCKQIGFLMVEPNVLELITNMLHSYLSELGTTTRQLTEVAGRTLSTPSDSILALIELGTPVLELPTFLQRCRHHGTLVIASPKVQNISTAPTPLRVGSTRPHHRHIPDYLPPFPDPHTYVRTEISGDPELTYENVRESSAMLKRNMEVSLKDFMLRTNPSISLFAEYENRVRNEARQCIEDQNRQKKARFMACQSEVETERLKNGLDEQMSEILDTDDAELKKSGEHELNSVIQDSITEEMFELKDTENSFVNRRLPSICQLIKPILDSRPYVAALMCDDFYNEAVDSPPSPGASSPQSSALLGNISSDELLADENPYLRQPRISIKVDDGTIDSMM